MQSECADSLLARVADSEESQPESNAIGPLAGSVMVPRHKLPPPTWKEETALRNQVLSDRHTFLFLWSSGRALVVVTGLLLEILPTIPSSESKKRKKGGFHPKPGVD
jgi:hypothetical protein